MTIDVLRAGLKVEEIEIDLRHRATGTDLAGQLHRAKQLRDVTRALAARGLVQAGLKDFKDTGGSLRAVQEAEAMTTTRQRGSGHKRSVGNPARPPKPVYRPTRWHRDHRYAFGGIIGATALTVFAGFLGPSAVTLTLGPRNSYLPPWYLPAGIVTPNEWFVSEPDLGGHHRRRDRPVDRPAGPRRRLEAQAQTALRARHRAQPADHHACRR